MQCQKEYKTFQTYNMFWYNVIKCIKQTLQWRKIVLKMVFGNHVIISMVRWTRIRTLLGLPAAMIYFKPLYPDFQAQHNWKEEI